jgi:hypothetical protein
VAGIDRADSELPGYGAPKFTRDPTQSTQSTYKTPMSSDATGSSGDRSRLESDEEGRRAA